MVSWFRTGRQSQTTRRPKCNLAPVVDQCEGRVYPSSGILTLPVVDLVGGGAKVSLHAVHGHVNSATVSFSKLLLTTTSGVKPGDKLVAESLTYSTVVQVHGFTVGTLTKGTVIKLELGPPPGESPGQTWDRKRRLTLE